MIFLLISRQKANFSALDFIDCPLIQLGKEVEVMKSWEASSPVPPSVLKAGTIVQGVPSPTPRLPDVRSAWQFSDSEPMCFLSLWSESGTCHVLLQRIH